MPALKHLTVYGYPGLFLAAFLAATVLPVGSEPVFVALLAGGLDMWTCILVASVGNWLGGMTNYGLGRLGKTDWIERRLKIPPEKINRMRDFLSGKGAAMAFFSFLPVVGDLIALALGYMRANILIVNVSMFLGKFLRFIALAYGTKYGIDWLNE